MSHLLYAKYFHAVLNVTFRSAKKLARFDAGKVLTAVLPSEVDVDDPTSASEEQDQRL